MLRTCIQFLSIFLTIGSARLLARGSFGLSAADLVELSSTKFGYNLDVVRNLAVQQAGARMGMVLLLIAAALQFANASWPMRLADFAVDVGGIVAALVLAVPLVVGSDVLTKRMAAHTTERIAAIHRARSEERAGSSLSPRQ